MLKQAKFIPFFIILAIALGCCPYCYIPEENPDLIPAYVIPKNIRVALVLGSGGVRGMAHVGVLEVLEEAGIPIDLIVGSSAGSIVGALYADNPCAEEIRHAVWGIKTQSLVDIDFWHCRYGLSQGRTMRKVLDKHLKAKTFEELKIPLVVVTTDLYSGELVPIGSGNLIKAVQASSSIPFIFVPCDHMGRILVDGGIINPVPVKVARDLGASVVIAVDLSELLHKTFPTNLFQIATRSAEIAFMWQNEACTRNADVVIRPKTCGVGTFNDKMKWEIYQAGKQAAKECLPKILEALATHISEEEKNQKGKTWQLTKTDCYSPQIYLE